MVERSAPLVSGTRSMRVVTGTRVSDYSEPSGCVDADALGSIAAADRRSLLAKSQPADALFDPEEVDHQRH